MRTRQFVDRFDFLNRLVRFGVVAVHRQLPAPLSQMTRKNSLNHSTRYAMRPFLVDRQHTGLRLAGSFCQTSSAHYERCVQSGMPPQCQPCQAKQNKQTVERHPKLISLRRVSQQRDLPVTRTSHSSSSPAPPCLF